MQSHEQAAIRLKELCLAKGITPAAFARMVGVSRQQVYRWFSLSQRMPDLKIEKSAQVFGLHPAELRYSARVEEIDRDRLKEILIELFQKIQETGTKVTGEQIAHTVSAVYSQGNRGAIIDYLEVIAAGSGQKKIDPSMILSPEGLSNREAQ